MMQNSEFEQITAVLMQPWNEDALIPHPQLDGGNSDQQWFQLIEQLEFRLLLAFSLTDRAWLKSSRRVLKANGSTISRHSLRQCQLMINAFVVKYCSQPQSKTPDFPFLQIMESILIAKAHLAHEPSVKMIMRAAVTSIQNGTPIAFQEICTFPESQKRALFKYFTVYGVLMGWISFDAELKNQLTPFNHLWLQEEDGILLSLISYSLLSKNSAYNLRVMLRKTADSLKSWPNLESIYNAIVMSSNFKQQESIHAV